MLRLSTFPSDVRGVALAGFSTASSALATAADTILTALGKLQSQMSLAAPLSGATFTGPISAPQVSAQAPSAGSVSMVNGGAANTGHVSFLNPSGTHQGFIGYCPVGGMLQLESEGGATGYNVTGNLQVGGTVTLGAATAATPAVGTNTTAVATTAFVLGQASTATPLINGTASAGTATAWSRADHVHPKQSISLLDFGADPTGTNDSTAAVNTWITAVMAGAPGQKGYAPAGTYLCASQITMN